MREVTSLIWQTLFLWEKFLHLFEHLEALKINSAIKQSAPSEASSYIADPNNYIVFLKALDDIIRIAMIQLLRDNLLKSDEILLIGRQPPKENDEGSRREIFPETSASSNSLFCSSANYLQDLASSFVIIEGKTDKELDPADIVSSSCDPIAHSLFQIQVPPERKSRRFMMPSEEEIVINESKLQERTYGGSTPRLKTVKSNSLKLNRDRIVSGQAILSLFGKWLFEVANLSVIYN